ncbi:MAG TPA: hypothetical protein PKH94_05190 [Bacteroidales bacterium]|nr:hypothetical protein [Bacteroidales bacterium]HNS46613.1 hypothetical protein [Bacteroidales bacterium]
MKINRDNYEIYFIDYLDGTLPPEMVSELLLFLDANPDLQEELNDLDAVPVRADPTIQYSGKELLKQNPIVSVGSVNELNYQEYLIGFSEGDLSVPEIRILERFLLRNPQAKKELDQYRAARLVPDHTIVFPGKNRLKKYPFGIQARKALYYISGAAAILLLALMVIWPTQKKEPAVVQEQLPMHEIPGEPEPLKKNESPSPVYTATLPRDRQKITTHSPVAEPAATPLIETPETSSITAIHPVHRGIQYQLVNPSFQPGTDIKLAEKRDLYSQVLPYLTETDQYTLSPYRTDKDQSSGSFGEAAFSKVREIFTGNPSKMKSLKYINLWTVADLGVAGINQLTNSDLRIQRIMNEEGRIISYALVNEKGEIKRTRMKNDAGQFQHFE